MGHAMERFAVSEEDRLNISDWRYIRSHPRTGLVNSYTGPTLNLHISHSFLMTGVPWGAVRAK
jgi:hypothetical protein